MSGSRIYVVWLDAQASTIVTENDTFSLERACDIHKVIAGQLEGADVKCEFEEVNSERDLFALLDKLVTDDPSLARETLFWLLLPRRSPETGMEHLPIGTNHSLLLPRLLMRYPLSWLMFHFPRESLREGAQRILRSAYSVEGNGGCQTYGRQNVALSWFFSFGLISEEAINKFRVGVRQWFDPIGFRGAMLDLLKLHGHEVSSVETQGNCPWTTRQSRRVFMAAAIDEEPVFANCMGYAAYRAGMGALPVSMARVFGDDDVSPLGDFIEACANSKTGGADDIVVAVLRDLDLQFGDAPEHSEYFNLNRWPKKLLHRILQNPCVCVRAISAIADEISREAPEGWSKEDERLGVNNHGEYLGMNKPLDSLLLLTGTGLEIFPFSGRLVSATMGRRGPVSVQKRSPLRHHAPQHLQGDLQFLELMANRLGNSERVDDLVFAALLQLVRLEALRGAGPLLIMECLEEIYLLEARIEIESPYFNSQPDLRARLQELGECSSQIASHLPRHGIQIHLTRQVLGKMKVLYQANGVFGASDELQLELLTRSKNPLAEKLLRVGGFLVRAFFNPLLCLLYWIFFNTLALTGAEICFPIHRSESFFNDFVYLAITGNASTDLVVGSFVNGIVFINMIFVAVFTTSLFRWVTRD